MPFKIEATPEFLNEAKKLARKYPSLKNDLSALSEQLLSNPKLGTPLGKDVFKIRLAITSKGKMEKRRCPGNYLRKDYIKYSLSRFNL